MQKNQNPIPRLRDTILGLFSSPVLLHYALPVLMVCLIIGTVAQKYIGLYEATQIFFAAPFFWLGPVPLPGLPVVLGLIALNLAGKLIFKSPWHWRNAGIIITHLGALLLLVGGLLTAALSTEGYIDIAEGQSSNTVSDYHQRNLVFLDDAQQEIATLDKESLKIGQTIPLSGGPIRMEILDLCRHCEIVKRTQSDDTYHGMAQHMQLKPAKLRLTNEENMGGITFRISGAPEESQNGIYLVLEDIPQSVLLTTQEGKTITIALRKARRTLPFKIELIDFRREVYPGTDRPMAYESTVRIDDGGRQWQTVISMNAPLRYRGYTFYQSSFIQTPEAEISVLAAVWNVGRSFPYIASLTMGFGILLHLFLRRRRV